MHEQPNLTSSSSWRPPAVAWLLVAVGLVVGLSSLSRPTERPATAPPDQFSSERAMAHVSALAREPRPTGSPANARARAYIRAQLEALELSPEVREAPTAVRWGGDVEAATVHNVIAKLPGTRSEKAIALMGHYDSVPTTSGASDCGGCVATLLETVRALRAGPPLQNDVILIFTDGEELAGQPGADAFVRHHPWLREIGLVVNFEGIGRTGPSILFETSPGNRWLVREFGRAVAHPVAQSWLDEVYKLTPLNTDLTYFVDAGLAGLNFAHMSEGTIYHTELDNAETMAQRSLQHHGSQALALARHFGNLDWSSVRSGDGGDAVFFTLVPGLLVSYPARWSIPLAAVAGLLLVGVGFAGRRRQRVSVRGVLCGFSAFLGSVAVAAGVAGGAWWLISQAHEEYRVMVFGRVYGAHLYLVAFIALAVAIAAAMRVLIRKRVELPDQVLGVLLLWWILAVLSSVLLHGLSYLFIWPLLFSALGLGWVVWREAEVVSWQSTIALTLSSLPGVAIFSAAVSVMFHFAPTTLISLPIFFVALLLGLLIPSLDLLSRTRRWLVPAAASAVGVGLLVAGSVTAGFDAQHPRPNAVAYLLNADTGQASWFSPGTEPDAWTAQFFTANPPIITLGELFPLDSGFRRSIITSQAPTVSLAAPRVETLDDRTEGEARRLRLRIDSVREAPIVTVEVAPRRVVRAVTIDSQRIESSDRDRARRGPWSLTYHAVPQEGLVITLETVPDQPFRIQVADQSPGIPEIPGRTFRPRPGHMMPLPNFNYGTVVVTTWTIPASSPSEADRVNLPESSPAL
ncbi:MAG: M20/M25/M40 family metallo-hydrolase [bacterium]|nr:M20/M25/M40 family metallo-hydrolase [bacterium]